MRRQILALSLLAAVAFGAVGPIAAQNVSAAPRTASQTHLFDKTRFAFHLGLAYFAFHHFVYKPYRAGAFKKGASHRTRDIIKAGVALLVTYHELKKAYDIANHSSSGLLRAFVKPMNGLIAKSKKVADQLRGGQYNPAQVTSIVNSANGFSRQVTSKGISIRDIPVPGL